MPDAATTVPALGALRRSARNQGPRSHTSGAAPRDRLPRPDAEPLLEAHDPNAVLGVWFPHTMIWTSSSCWPPTRSPIAGRSASDFRGHNRDGPMIVEQQAYLTERSGLIDWMRIVCSGQRAPT